MADAITKTTLDREIRQLKELQIELTALGCKIDDLRGERDLLREENQRLQLEVARLRLAHSEAIHAMTRVSKLNPKCAEIGAGMLLTIIDECTAAIAKLEAKQ